MKRIMDLWKLNAQRLYITLGVMLACGMIVMGGTCFSMHTDAAFSAQFRLEDTAHAYMANGALAAVMMGLFFHLFLGVFSYGADFNMAVSFGCTRREFIFAQWVVSLAGLLVEAAAAALISLMERIAGAVLYPGLQYQSALSYLSDGRIVAGIVLFVPLLCMLLGTLILRFGTKAWWGIWVVWMVSWFGGAALVSYSEKHPDSLRTRILRTVLEHVTEMTAPACMVLLLVTASVVLLVSVLFLRRQEVTQ